MPSHNLGQIKLGDLDIFGYSVAGEETVIAIPQLDICFDVGKAPEQIIPINNILLSHGHIDHCSGFAYYLSHRKFCGITTGTILAPAPLMAGMQKVLDGWAILDGNAIPVNMVGMKGGDEYEVRHGLFARAFYTQHVRGSLGYTMVEKRKKLKAEYLSLSGQEIIKLKQDGMKIDYVLEMPLVSYFGDTEPGAFMADESVVNSKVIITECTFFYDDHIDRARAGRHMHINDLAPLLENLKCEHIIITHITQRIGVNDMRYILRKKVSKETCEKIIILNQSTFEPVCAKNKQQ
ncbi:MAG: hypothetical protein A2Y07_02755 [Planctomycetes bacterium GWF2_50_10]|nr:MAG: hypothetical protein A2Y07_02755 [Planctomycetes bacterium GWF2_50_10]